MTTFTPRLVDDPTTRLALDLGPSGMSRFDALPVDAPAIRVKDRISGRWYMVQRVHCGLDECSCDATAKIVPVGK